MENTLTHCGRADRRWTTNDERMAILSCSEHTLLGYEKWQELEETEAECKAVRSNWVTIHALLEKPGSNNSDYPISSLRNMALMQIEMGHFLVPFQAIQTRSRTRTSS